MADGTPSCQPVSGYTTFLPPFKQSLVLTLLNWKQDPFLLFYFAHMRLASHGP